MNKKYVLWSALALFQWVSWGCDMSDEPVGKLTASVDGIAHTEEIPKRIHQPKATGFTLWQLPSQSGIQMMSYVLESAEGNLVVVDGGWKSDGEYLRRFLKEYGNHVSAWFITHPHADHLEALTWMLSNQEHLKIDTIYASFPPLEWIQEHESGTAKTLADFTAALARSGKSYTDLNPGDVFDIDEIHIEILATENMHITDNAVNNSSMMMRVSGPEKTVLFTGDLGELAGDDLLAVIDHKKMKADYVQMAHHGQGCVNREFYEVVQPDYCLWPTPLWLWNNARDGVYDSGPWTTLETRQWMKDLNVKSNYVSGVSGLVKIQ